MKELQERIKELGIHLYQATSDEDILIAEWWDLLVLDGELSKLVASSAYPLSAFYGLFKSPNILAYTVKDDQLESAHWAEPVSTSEHAVFFSSWSTESLRGTKRQALIMTAVYGVLFALGKKTLLGITKQEDLVELHKKMGYVILDPVPHLFDDDKAWIMYLTKTGFKNSRLQATANKIKE